MVKFVLGILIVCFTSFCGYVFAKKYRDRKQFFSQFHEFNERFLSEISYYRRPVKEFAAKYPYSGDFALLLADFLSSLDRGKRSVREAHEQDKEQDKEEDGDGAFEAAKLPFPDFLTEEERGFARDYFSMLGRGDSGSQKAYFSSVKSFLSDYKCKSGEDCKRYGDLYLKMGFLLGLLILVLIV